MLTGTGGVPASDFRGGGDVEGDGADDLLLLGRSEDRNTVCVVGDLPTGTIPARDLAVGAAPCVVSYSQEGDGLLLEGRLHDVNADGYADLMLEAPSWKRTGGVFVFTSPLPAVADIATADTQFIGPDTDAPSLFGTATALGDLDGDGATDVAINNQVGYWRGTVSIFRSPGEGVHAAEDADRTFAGHEEGPTLPPGDHMGFGVPAIVDVDLDGLGDLLVGAPGDDDNGTDSGAVYLFLGAHLF